MTGADHEDPVARRSEYPADHVLAGRGGHRTEYGPGARVGRDERSLAAGPGAQLDEVFRHDTGEQSAGARVSRDPRTAADWPGSLIDLRRRNDRRWGRSFPRQVNRDQGDRDHDHRGGGRQRDEPGLPAAARRRATGCRDRRQRRYLTNRVGSRRRGRADAVFDAAHDSSLSIRASAATPRDVADLMVPRLMPIAAAASSSGMSR